MLLGKSSAAGDLPAQDNDVHSAILTLRSKMSTIYQVVFAAHSVKLRRRSGAQPVPKTKPTWEMQCPGQYTNKIYVLAMDKCCKAAETPSRDASIVAYTLLLSCEQTG